MLDENPKYEDENTTSKREKLKSVGNKAIAVGVIAIPLAIAVGTTYYGIKVAKVQLDLAQAQLAVLNSK